MVQQCTTYFLHNFNNKPKKRIRTKSPIYLNTIVTIMCAFICLTQTYKHVSSKKCTRSVQVLRTMRALWGYILTCVVNY